MDNDDNSDERHCRRNYIRPSSSSMMRAPSWNPGFGAQSSDDIDSIDDDNNEGETDRQGASIPSSDNDISQADPEILKQIKLRLEFEIPTVYLKRSDKSTSSFHVYQTNIKAGENAKWSIFKRYSQFLQFHHQLRQILPGVRGIPFPPKKRLNSKASTIVQERRCRLEEYMRRISELIAGLPISLADIETFQKLANLTTDYSSTSPASSYSAQQVTGETGDAGSLNESLHSEQDQEREAQERETDLSTDEKCVVSARCLFYRFITPDSTQDQTTVWIP